MIEREEVQVHKLIDQQLQKLSSEAEVSKVSHAAHCVQRLTQCALADVQSDRYRRFCHYRPFRVRSRNVRVGVDDLVPAHGRIALNCDRSRNIELKDFHEDLGCSRTANWH